MQTKVFTGEYFEKKFVRRVVTEDPGTGSKVTQTQRYDGISNFVVDRISGYGPSENGELQITLSGQYAPFKYLRITAAAQHAEVVKDMLKEKDLVDVSAVKFDESNRLKSPVMLKKEIIFDKVIGLPMRTFSQRSREVVNTGGFVIHELYLNNDGKSETVIGPPENVEKAPATGISF